MNPQATRHILSHLIMAGSFEDSSTSFMVIFEQFIACLGRSKVCNMFLWSVKADRTKVRDGRSKADQSSQGNAEEQLEAKERYFVTRGTPCTCNEGINSRHGHANNVRHTTYDTKGPSIGIEDTKSVSRDSHASTHDESGSSSCACMEAMRVTKVISIHYEERTLSTATLCIELDLNGRKTLRWFEYKGLIRTPGEKEAIPGVKDAIERFRPMWRY